MILKYILFFCICNVLLIPSAYSQTRYVKAGSPNPVPPYTSWATASDSIGKCIAIANETDTIFLSDGIFNEFISIKKRQVLIGSGKYQTQIGSESLNSPSNDIFRVIELFDSAEVYDLSIIGNNQFTTGIHCRFEQGYVSKRNRIERILFNKLQTAVSISDGIISNCDAFVREFVYVRNPEFSNTLLVQVNNISGSKFITTRQNPFSQPGNSIIIVRGNIVSFIEQSIYISDDNLGPPGQEFEFYNNQFIIGAGGHYHMTTLNKSYRFINNTFYSNYNPPPTQESLFKITGSAAFRNNIFFNLKDIAHSSGNQPSEFSYNTIFGAPRKPYMDSTSLFDYPMFMNIRQDTSYWPIYPWSKLPYDVRLQKYSPVIDKGDPLISDRDGSRSDPGAFGGPYGISYAYKDTAPMLPFRGTLLYNAAQNSFRADWMRSYDGDISGYRYFLSPNEYDTTGPYIATGETQDTFAVIPVTNPPAGKMYFWIRAIDTAGHQSSYGIKGFCLITGVEQENLITPKETDITGIYPNPFNAEAKVDYVIGNRGSAIFRIYDINGALLQTIDKGELEKGNYNITLKMQNFASGVYFIRLEVKDSYSGKTTQTQSKKIVMVK